MYKVFINEVPVFFTEKNIKLEGFRSVLFQELDYQTFFSEKNHNIKVKINVICQNLHINWQTFISNFELREAAGGVVKNELGELLWIYSFDKWDLPKGHIEKGEDKYTAAVREVEEECGVKNLVIKKELETTYHVFEHKNKKIIKKTYWFLMHTKTKNQKLIPQQEEGITQVCFKTTKESIECLKNSYGNIKELLKEIV